jgi:16S rRNA (cytidine1402-2'-O)-methyltransferase
LTKHAEIVCWGHSASRVSDHQSFEILLSHDWSNRPGAIGYRATFDANAITSLRGRISATIRCGGHEDRFEATISPDHYQGSALIFRCAPAARARCFAFQTSKAAADLDPALREQLREPDARIIVTLTELGQSLCASGGLFLVGMPIGNQADLTPRALDVLYHVDLILAEDTRVATDALIWRGVHAPIRSCHDHNEVQRAEELTRRLSAGERVAFVADAGMPTVSDPGFRLVRAALSIEAYVTVVPGPSAALTALAVSGLSPSCFRFVGFPPRKGRKRSSFLDTVLAASDTSILYEAGNRIDDLLADIAQRDDQRQLALCRDLTKSTERVERGTAASVHALRPAETDARGEYVLVVAGRPESPRLDTTPPPIHAFVAALVAEGCPTAPIVKALRRSGTMSRADAYELVENLREAKDRESAKGDALGEL